MFQTVLNIFFQHPISRWCHLLLIQIFCSFNNTVNSCSGFLRKKKIRIGRVRITEKRWTLTLYSFVKKYTVFKIVLIFFFYPKCLKVVRKFKAFNFWQIHVVYIIRMNLAVALTSKAKRFKIFQNTSEFQ